jgi:hypothetical protein
MAININELIADAKAEQAASRAAAASAQKEAVKNKLDAEVRARSKSELNYANTLKPRLQQYESKLKIWANKIARGDKLSSTEQQEFDRLVEEYKSVNKAIDAAIKRSNDILVEARRGNRLTPDTVVKRETATTTGSAADDARLGVNAPASAPRPAPATTPRQTARATGGGTTGRTTGGTGGGVRPTTGSGKAVPSNFDPSSFRMADEASMGSAGGITPTGRATGARTPLDTLLAKTEFWYDLPDYIFKLDTKLGELLVQAVNEGWDNEKFLAKARLTPWWQKNADSVRTKIVNREKYNDLLKAGEDVKNTEYGMYLGKQMRAVKAKAKELADVTLTDEQAQSVAQKIYDGNLEDDPLAINALIVPFIGRTTSIVGTGTKQTGFGGQALQNYQTLQGIAKANGFSLKDILPNVSAITAGGDLETAVLRGLADGSIDINRVAQDARMLAAQGQPQYVRNLLGQGYDLEAIYAPYRKTMATELELDPNQIDLNDSTLRMAITDKGDMNLFDFKKQLRQDNRWQYTGTAKEEVSNAALKVLRDFGFQG